MMSFNQNPSAITDQQGFATSPRAIVLINGIQVSVTHIEVNTAQFGYADTFTIFMPLIGQTAPINRDYFATNQNVLVTIYIGFPPNPNSFTSNDLDLIITGNADQYRDNLGTNFIEISGRDLTSKFIEAKITQYFPNQTSSQIVTAFANEQGLTPQVTATSTVVGAFYQNQQTLLANQMSQWDMITYLAQQEDFQAFVSGNTFIFEPKTDQSSNPYIINYVLASSSVAFPYGNFISCEVVTNTNLAGNVQVTVRVPYDTRTGQAFSVKVKSTQTKGISNTTRKYVLRKPGLTPQQAQQLASQLLEQHTSQGVGLNISMPGDNILKKDSIIQLKGTGTYYDQTYFPDEIRREINFEDGGYRMYIYARNTNQDSTVDDNTNQDIDNNPETPT
jgi:phage protein D